MGRERSEFKVVLDGIGLTEKQERSISAAIQQVVTGHLAELDLEGDAGAGILALGGRFDGTQGSECVLLKAGQRAELEQFLQRGG